MNQQDIWELLKKQAEEVAQREPALKTFLDASIFSQSSFPAALAGFLAGKVQCTFLSAEKLKDIFLEAISANDEIVAATYADMRAVVERDPACKHELTPFLYFKGFHALQCHRVAHQLWNDKRIDLALDIQSRVSRVFSVDIHPAARIGKGILFDHATSIVIGETSVVEDNVSMLHGVTLGGTGKEDGDRHPKIRSCVLLGAGARILGNIEVGVGAKVGAGSVVLDPVPAHTTVAGVPAKVVGKPKTEKPGLEMDHCLE